MNIPPTHRIGNHLFHIHEDVIFLYPIAIAEPMKRHFQSKITQIHQRKQHSWKEKLKSMIKSIFYEERLIF
jgi:hypothetical protein